VRPVAVTVVLVFLNIGDLFRINLGHTQHGRVTILIFTSGRKFKQNLSSMNLLFSIALYVIG
jgi:hypothetical protein